MPRFAGADLPFDQLLIGASAILSELHSDPKDQSDEQQVQKHGLRIYVGLGIHKSLAHERRAFWLTTFLNLDGSLVRILDGLPLQFAARNRDLRRASRSNRRILCKHTDLPHQHQRHDRGQKLLPEHYKPKYARNRRKVQVSQNLRQLKPISTQTS